MPKKKNKSAGKILDKKVGKDADLRAMVEQETINAQVAMLIHEVRTELGLTQKQLAEKVGTQQPVIARLEDADYEGHSLSMLNRIAEKLGKRLEIRMVEKVG
ncbi:MAG: helix-turn-helix domain-containing protein [Nitrospira sp.]|nr:helix-turn-helix domain-containing protein [Nitrospira sp.]